MKMSQTTSQHPVEEAILTQRQYQLVLALAAVFVFGGAGFIGWGMFSLLSRPLVPPAPITYHQTTVAPAQSDLCPGLTLAFTVNSTVSTPEGYVPGTPIAFTVTRSYWDVTHNRQATTRATSPVQILTETRSVPGPGEYSGTKRFILPDLAPGAYKLLTTAQNGGTAGAGYNVPFTIRDDCQP